MSGSDSRTALLDIACLRFEVPAWWATVSPEEIEREDNGVGSAALPPIARRILSWALPYGRLPAKVHDVEFAHSDGSRDSFLAANRRWWRNCRIWIFARRPAYSWRRYVELWRAYQDRRILDSTVGWNAWVAAYHKRIMPGAGAYKAEGV